MPFKASWRNALVVLSPKRLNRTQNLGWILIECQLFHITKKCFSIYNFEFCSGWPHHLLVFQCVGPEKLLLRKSFDPI